MRERLRELFGDVLRELDPAPLVERALHAHTGLFAPTPRILVLAVGKAARAMASAAAAFFARTLPNARTTGLVVAPDSDAGALEPFEVLVADHPVPSEGSFRAGRRALELCREAGPDTGVLFLVSGGASSLCELPIDETVALGEWQAMHEGLVGSGQGIESINALRKLVSATKGGRLAAAAEHAHVRLTLAVADVPNNDLDAVGSAPTIGGRDDAATLLQRARDADLLRFVPPSVRTRLERGELAPPLRRGDPLLRDSHAEILLGNDAALLAALRRCQAAGLRCVIDRSTDELPYERAAQLLLARLEGEVARGDGPVAVVAGGEVRVALPKDPGSGGRNLQFALECARRIDGQPIAVLSAGTDGVDGSAPAAGAAVDGTTCARAREGGFDLDAALRAFAAYPPLHAIGDAIETGRTGTNVRDVRVLVHPGSPSCPTRNAAREIA